jgi:hypothetical protein
MNIFRLAGELFLLYLLYKFIFDFIIPVYESSKKIKSQFGEMQEKMKQNMNQFQQQQQQPAQPTTEKPPQKEGDYIDFEEVK